MQTKAAITQKIRMHEHAAVKDNPNSHNISRKLSKIKDSKINI